MSKLCISLPPFAPDYSGAAAALFDVGGMIVIHDASGCTGNYTGYDEPRWYGSSSAVFCSGLRHMDAVLGNDKRVIDRIVEASKELEPKFIALLGSPVPMVIGTDFTGIANEIEYTTGIPAIGLSTRGLAYYGKGFADAMHEMLKKFAKEKKETIPGSINLLGITPLDFYIQFNHKDFRELFDTNGIEVLASFSMGMTIEELRSSVRAQLNVAVSQAGVQLAEIMKRKYGIPYIAITPMGDGALAVNAVKGALKGDYEEFKPESGEADILIAGEQIIGNSIREYLHKNNLTDGVNVACLFDVSKAHMAEGDIVCGNEGQLRKLVNSGKYKTVIADPMVKELITDENKSNIRFLNLPHVAVSSKIHWDDSRRWISIDTQNWLSSIKE